MLEISSLSYINFLKNSGINFFLKNNPNNFYQKNIVKKTNKDSDKNIGDINNIKELELFIYKNLSPSNQTLVKSDGIINSNIMFIGGNSTPEELEKGKPIVGHSAILFDKMLEAINLKRKNIFIVNVIPVNLKKNNNTTNKDIFEWLPRIQRHIEIINPKLIVLLGTISAKSVLGTNIDVQNLRNKWHEYKSINIKNSIKCLVTHHPLTLLTNPILKKESWSDLQILQRKIIDEKI